MNPTAPITDQNYNKASIAHNVLTIYDPNEKFNAYNGKDNKGNAVSFPNGVNDGGPAAAGGEPATMGDVDAACL